MARSAVDETSDSGAFQRTASTFRNFVSRDSDSQFPAESGRYHLYISYACPWASRCISYLKIKGLDDAISFSVRRLKTPFETAYVHFMTVLIWIVSLFGFHQSVKPIWGRTKETDEHMGWVFPDSDNEVQGAEPDHFNGAKSVRELYEIASRNYTGKYTVPVSLFFVFFC